jgi:hypothetical protein
MSTVTKSDAATEYRDRGFVLFDTPILDADLISGASEGMDEIREGRYDSGRPPAPSSWNPGDDPGKLCKVELPQRANRAVHGLVSSPAIGACAAAATGASMIQVWWVQLLHKPSTPPGTTSATNVGWHRDWTYWADAWDPGSELLTAWVALTDVREDCGPMSFAIGTHLWKSVEGGDFFRQDLDRNQFTVPEGETWREELALLPPGGLSLHDCLTLHGSGPNHSGAPRRSFAIHLRTEKSRTRDGNRAGLVEYLDDLQVCPIIHGERVEDAFR